MAVEFKYSLIYIASKGQYLFKYKDTIKKSFTLWSYSKGEGGV